MELGDGAQNTELPRHCPHKRGILCGQAAMLVSYSVSYPQSSTAVPIVGM